jgi:predicted nucleic acid-binding protein
LFDAPVPLHAPHLPDIEFAQVLRRFEARGGLSGSSGRAAPRMLHALPIGRHPHVPLVDRVWALRANLTAYDAAHVALAEAFDAGLVTGDVRMQTAVSSATPLVWGGDL